MAEDECPKCGKPRIKINQLYCNSCGHFYHSSDTSVRKTVE